MSIFSIINLISLGLAVAVFAQAITAADENTTNEQSSSGRAGFTLKRLFDFESYQKVFNKHYGSSLEQMARAKLFLARAFRAFVSAVSYKYHRSSFYLAINHMSDWTPEELASTRMDPEFFDFSTFNGDEPPDGAVWEADMEPIVDLEVIEEKFEEIEGKKEAGFKEIVNELKEAEKQNIMVRSKRDVESGNEQVRSVRVGDLIRKFEMNSVPSQAEQAPKIKNVVIAHENQQSLKEMSLQEQNNSAMEQVKVEVELPKVEPAPLVVAKANEIVEQAGANFVNSILMNASLMFSKLGHKSQSPSSDEQQNLMYVDHRNSKCYMPIKEQGMCGSCWALAGISLFEWSYCYKTGEQVSFSEQYVVDCGHRVGAKGCIGGKLDSVGKFAQHFGLELTEDYPYKARDFYCPYKDNTNINSMGFIRLGKDEQLIRLPLHDFETHLKKGPIVVSMLLSPAVLEYGGGVASGEICSPDWPHAALLVGHGREDGEEFWLFRFAYTSFFGEGGHYKLNKKAKCVQKYGYVLKNRFNSEPKMNYNPNYDPKAVQDMKALLVAADFNVKKYKWNA